MARSLAGGQEPALYPRGQHGPRSCLSSSLATCVMEGNASSASSQKMTQNLGEQLPHQKVVLPSRGTSASWRNGLTGTPWSSTRGNARCCQSLGAREVRLVSTAQLEVPKRWRKGADSHRGAHRDRFQVTCLQIRRAAALASPRALPRAGDAPRVAADSTSRGLPQ